MDQNRFILTIPPYLKEKLVKLAKKKGCSQAEIVKLALHNLFRDEEK
ncbi:MAG: hypothetical protein KC550_06380 [Nanoarchaeota archaeon]|nr:hypothetical protein [Nanoarchaeota archaeon]